ncbi:MAG: Na+/H+ antiporter NhaC [Gammaproteobacteria bacterium]|nr:Na+/H+ antiporter NhaC [Gammaproteobacteria bacterium]
MSDSTSTTTDPRRHDLPIIHREPSVMHAAVTILGLACWISFGIFYLKSGLHGILLLGLVWVAANCMPLRCNYLQIREAMQIGMDRAMPAMFIFLMIGVVIATFILSGTVGSLIYYGLKFMHPAVFLPAGLILCSIMSLAVGTSWGTVATGGVVLIGVGGAMGIPLPIVAGMIISGASFGDKMSPVSDTTNLAAVSADTNLYAHIKSMSYTTGPSYLIALVAFSWIGMSFAEQSLPKAELEVLLNGLDATFTINVFMLLPLIVLLVLSMRAVAAEAAMLVAALIAALLAIFFQSQGTADVVTAFYDGAKISTGIATLDPLLNRGGMIDMVWTFSLSFIAISLGSVLQQMGFLKVLMEWLMRQVQRTASLVTSAILTTFAANMTLGESYISLILTGQMFKQKFNEQGVDRAVLSRSLEEGGTLMTALIPWTTTGAFYAATLGVATLDYAQWTILNWVNPLMGIAFAWIGLAIFRATKEEPAETEPAESR